MTRPDQLLETLAERRSFKLKDLDPSPIDLGLVAQMLEAANWAPSHGKTEPWRFVVFSGEARATVSNAMAHAYRELNGGDDCSPEGLEATARKAWLAPVWIGLGVAPDPDRPEWEELIAFGCAVHNAQLMACSLGLGSKWTSGSTVMHPHVADAVGYPPGTRHRGFLYVGRPTTPWPSGERRPSADKITWADGDPARIVHPSPESRE